MSDMFFERNASEVQMIASLVSYARGWKTGPRSQVGYKSDLRNFTQIFNLIREAFIKYEMCMLCQPLDMKLSEN